MVQEKYLPPPSFSYRQWPKRIPRNAIRGNKLWMPINRRICVAGYSETADIWSVACLLWELATKTYLFDIQSKRAKDSKDEAHLAKIVEYCGHIPRYLIRNGKHSPNFFSTNGELLKRESLRPTKLTNLLIRCKGWTTRNATEFVDFIMPMLNTDPLKRTSACKALGSPYLSNIVISGIQREGLDYTLPKRGKN